MRWQFSSQCLQSGRGRVAEVTYGCKRRSPDHFESRALNFLIASTFLMCILSLLYDVWKDCFSPFNRNYNQGIYALKICLRSHGGWGLSEKTRCKPESPDFRLHSGDYIVKCQTALSNKAQCLGQSLSAAISWTPTPIPRPEGGDILTTEEASHLLEGFVESSLPTANWLLPWLSSTISSKQCYLCACNSFTVSGPWSCCSWIPRS